MRKTLYALVLCITAIAFACTKSTPPEPAPRPITLQTTSLDIVPGTKQSYVVLGENLDQVRNVIATPQGSQVTNLSATSRTLSFDLFVPATARAVDVTFQTDGQRILSTTPLLTTNVTTQEMIAVRSLDEKMSTQMDAISKQIAGFQSQVEIANGLQTQVREIRGLITKHNERALALEKEINGLQTRMLMGQEEFAEKTKQLQTAQGSSDLRISQLEQRLEQRFAQVQSQYDSRIQALQEEQNRTYTELLSDFNLLATAMTQAEVPGAFGFGHKPLLDDEIRDRVRARITAERIAPPLSVVPSQPR